MGTQKIFAMLLMLCLPAVPVSAKSKNPPISIPRGNWAAVNSMEMGASVSLRMASGDRIEGKFLGLDADAIRLMVDKKEKVFPRSGVDEVWRLRVPDGKLNGTFIGMGAGVIAGVIAGTSVDARWTGEDALGPLLVAAGIGIGGAIGAIADAEIKGNRLVYKR